MTMDGRSRKDPKLSVASQMDPKKSPRLNAKAISVVMDMAAGPNPMKHCQVQGS